MRPYRSDSSGSLFGFDPDGDGHQDKADEADCGAYHDAAGAEDVGVELFGGASGAEHKQESKHYQHARYGHQYEVVAAKGTLVEVFTDYGRVFLGFGYCSHFYYFEEGD